MHRKKHVWSDRALLKKTVTITQVSLIDQTEFREMNTSGRFCQMFSMCLIVVSLSVTARAGDASDQMAQELASWRTAIAETPLPFNACFHAEYPALEWTQVACGQGSGTPFLETRLAISTSMQAAQRSGLAPQTVGGTSADWTALGSNLPSGRIINATGSFSSVTGVTSESGGGQSNSYSVQLNSNFFTSPACNGHANCEGYQQFVYSTGLQELLIQFWLINYGASCPSGWTRNGSTNCFKDSPTVHVPVLVATGLGTLSMSATSGGVGLGGFSQPTEVVLTIGSNSYSTYDVQTDTLGLTNGWTVAEFNVFGDGGNSVANFNPGSYITVYNSIRDVDLAHAGHTYTSMDGCFQETLTAESNNLNLGTCTATPSRGTFKSYPYISFTEHN